MFIPFYYTDVPCPLKLERLRRVQGPSDVIGLRFLIIEFGAVLQIAERFTNPFHFDSTDTVVDLG